MLDAELVSKRAPIGPKWTGFSLVFGVLGPVACFATASADRVFGSATIGVDVYAAVCVLTLIAWFVGGRDSAKFDAFASGTFFAAALVALPALLITPIGVVLLIGALATRDVSMALSGLLGVQPGICLIIYGRNAHLADNRADALAGGGTFLGRRALGFATPIVIAIVPLVVPSAVQSICLRRVVDEIPNNERDWIDACRVVRWELSWDAWQKSRDDDLKHPEDPAALDRAARIADAYRRITGREIEHWVDPSD